MKKVLLSVVAALACSIAPALAADVPAKVTKAPVVAPAPSPFDIAFGAAIMTDYNFRGISQSNRKPSVAAYFEPRYNINSNVQLYVGLAGESISFPNRAAAEIDFYGGIRPTFGPLALDFGVWYYYYPGGTNYNGLTGVTSCANGAFGVDGVSCQVLKGNVSFWEVYGKATYTFNDYVALTGQAFYSPSWLHSGAPGTYASGILKLTAPSTMLPSGIGAYLSGELGHYWLGTTDSFYAVTAFPRGIKYPDYTTWNVGLGFTYKVFTLDLRYYDTDLSRSNCAVVTSDYTATFNAGSVTSINPGGFSSKWCSSTFIAKLSADLTFANLK